MRLQLPIDDPCQQWVNPIVRSSQLLQVRLEHLMAAVRSGPSVREMADIGPLVREFTQLFLKGTDPQGKNVQVDAVIEKGIPPVRVDSGRLIQVLLSLIGNAHEAISTLQRSGQVLVTTGTAFEDGKNWVTIEVRDDGPGIPDDFMSRIFEPFFTTKETGSGYGLYLASEIVKEQGGRLTVRNLPEGGAGFTIWLPTATSEVPAESAAC